MFTPGYGNQSACPVQVDRLGNNRKTIVYKENGAQAVLEDKFSSHSLKKKQTERLQVHNGKEKHGSGFFLPRQQQVNRNKIQAKNDRFRSERMKERK